ncbi:MAG: type II restriction endonuclease [Vicinamibacteria bacterium]
MADRGQLEFSLRGATGAERVAGVAVKQLVAVDLPDRESNQHEFNGVAQLREILGLERIERGLIRWFELRDDEVEFTGLASRFTWYDAREDKPRAAEWRFYYYSPHALANAREGDFVFLLALGEGRGRVVHAYVVAQGSTWERQLRWLFGLGPEAERKWAVRDATELRVRAKSIPAFDLLESLELEEPAAATPAPALALVRNRFGDVFPSTWEFSAFAREELGLSDEIDTDELLIRWIEREEELFRALEEYIVRRKLEGGFSNVDDFIGFSLSVHNRRKSRMGYALENHLRAILEDREIPHSYNEETENRARPDFLFPGIEQYRDESFPPDRLHMLGAKSTCKDRWRQVLSEAERIPEKHLITLEPGISEGQTNEMRASGLRLVVPAGLHDTYSAPQRAWLLTLEGFLELVRE